MDKLNEDVLLQEREDLITEINKLLEEFRAKYKCDYVPTKGRNDILGHQLAVMIYPEKLSH